ncbi:hypothetical protein KQX54_007956 [Cotesia glomerata]|uniref:Uncharacterized protein n=1 Tax=Cotesia glomerata TaxID=32391 RepID=A0AAV7J660_COTGL|nr:hypothetical protein KQX54_007956 [Cotesia glomerata]
MTSITEGVLWTYSPTTTTTTTRMRRMEAARDCLHHQPRNFVDLLVYDTQLQSLWYPWVPHDPRRPVRSFLRAALYQELSASFFTENFFICDKLRNTYIGSKIFDTIKNRYQELCKDMEMKLEDPRGFVSTHGINLHPSTIAIPEFILMPRL